MSTITSKKKKLDPEALDQLHERWTAPELATRFEHLEEKYRSIIQSNRRKFFDKLSPGQLVILTKDYHGLTIYDPSTFEPIRLAPPSPKGSALMFLKAEENHKGEIVPTWLIGEKVCQVDVPIKSLKIVPKNVQAVELQD